MSQNFNISKFLYNLEQNQPKSRGKFRAEPKIEKVYLSHPDWQGKYQILPMISSVDGQPMAFLKDVREIKLPRKTVNSDGTEKEMTSWYKILPPEAYVMQSSDGNIVSSLTAADENLLKQVQASFDILYGELGGNSKERDPKLNKTISYMRRRNYSLFYGRCLNHWTSSDPRNAKHQNFSGLFICSAKNFSETILNNLQDSVMQYGDTNTWAGQIYNRETTGRTGFLLFSVNLGVGGAIGYSLTAQHILNNQVQSAVIPEDEAEMMQDPIEGFLGWQADKREPGRLFNKALMEDLLNNINSQIAAIRSSKGINPAAASVTSEMANMGQQAQAPQTLDPMLQSQYSATPGMTNPEAVMNGNTNPYQTPPAAQIDPITQNPVSNGAPFAGPSFANTDPF